MNEAMLHKLSEDLGGRFRLTSLVQKRLVQLMIARDEIITRNSGGRPVRLVVEEVASGTLQLVSPEGDEITPEIEASVLPAREAEAE